MSHPVIMRPSEANSIDRISPIGGADHGVRLLGPIGAGGAPAAETESSADHWESAVAASFNAGPVVDPLQNVLGCLTEIIRSERSPAERPSDHPFADDHGLALHQEELESLPGVVLNTFDVDGPVWLAVEALTATEPPAIDSDLEMWVELSSDPDRRPMPRDNVVVTVDEIEKNRLTFARHARPEDFSPAASHDAGAGAWSGRLRLEQRTDLVHRIERYVAGPWTAWAETERARRRTMAIHQRLSEMATALDADLTKEIMWGIALSSWRYGGRQFELPLFERPVEIEIIERPDAEIRIRPRFVGAAVNLRALEALAPDAALALCHKSERLIEALEQRGELSPFTPIGLEQILNAVGAQPGQKAIRGLAASEDAPPSDAGDPSVAAGRWVISARRRPESLALRDIDCLKNAIEHAPQSECCLSDAVEGLLAQPNGRGHASARRHLSSIVGGPIDIAPAPKPDLADQGDLFFPLPASIEDVEVVRELSRSDGLVVQSAGRDERITTLVNIVCHHLALGSRILVVSRDETALSLLHQKLPSSIRELTVSSTGSDKDVLRKAEALASRLQPLLDTTNLRDHAGQIGRLERDIISKRSQIASLDDEIADIVRRNLRLAGSVPELSFELIEGLVTGQDVYSWFTDRPICLLANTAPLVAAVDEAGEARRRLAGRLKHIDDDLPEIATLPDAAAILALHEELRQQAGLSSDEGRDEDLALDAIAMFGLDATSRLAADLDALVSAHRAIADQAWLARLSPLGTGKTDVSPGLDKVVGWARDASFQLSRSAEFAKRQVQAPVELFTKRDAIRVVERLAAGEKAFARFSPSRRGLKAAIEAITVDRVAPSTPADWRYVGRFLLWRHDLHSLRTRWTSIATRIDAPAVQLESARAFDDLERVVRGVEAAIVTAALAVRNVVDACRKLSMPDSEIDAMLADVQRPTAFGAAIRSVMKRVSGPLVELARLGELFAGAGELAASVQADVLSQIGDPEVDPQRLEARWAGVLATMDSIAQARGDYELVRTACRMAIEAGAPDLAHRLRTEPAIRGAEDTVPRSDWVTAWNWAVLMRIENPDERQLLYDLSAQRHRLEKRSLALFETVISARMTLGIAQNASGPVRQSLKRFKDTMQKMASACSGPTARRLRVAARSSLDGWLEDVPCHVMPAWRVAELLPARIGTFDLLVVDHASRSDLRELTAMLRARKVLISDERRDTGRSELVRNEVGIEPKNLRGIPPALRRLLLPDASLRDFAEILFPERIVEIRPRSGDVEAAAIGASLQPERSETVDALTREAPKPKRTDAVATKRRAPPLPKANAAHTLEDEIATLAKYLSLARRSGTELVAKAGAVIDGPTAQRPEARPAMPKASPEVRVLRRRPPRVAATEAVILPAQPERPLAVLPPAAVVPAKPDPAAARPNIVVDPQVIADQPDQKGPSPVIEVAVEAVVKEVPASTEPAKQPEPSAAPAESKIHPSLLEMAFKAVEDTAKPRRYLSRRRVMAVAAVGLLAIAGVAAAYWERAPEWGQVLVSSATPASAQPSEPAPRTVGAERIMPDGKQVVASDDHATVGQAAAAVAAPAQAFLYHEDPQDPKGKRFSGKVTWSLEQSKGPRLDSSPVIKGDIEIENGMKVSMTLRRNGDLELPASHVMELAFNLPDQAAGGLSSLRGVGLKGEETERGIALATQTARVTPKFFMIALSANDVDTKRNMMLLTSKKWFDIPIVYETGNRALLSIEKGGDGERVFNNAVAAWGQ
ncbi:AAA family ATPase [Bradyrhizobium ontarionense]|uniref:AAA family ATPase n=1 Tax=Bradyrhizobium ontarionense TaxID=2898149 RepID=A0ABY3R7M6_9BRAD|nr:AAA family ATPase [Bradyrhizobium sp. A19]UFZ03340.1 AAA family ATPase [Bradyrhizobium sp. A19]